MDDIRFTNIRTNNLKGLDFSVQKYSTTCVIGPSGSGKSSLVFNTCNAVIESEYKRLIGDHDESYDYIVEEYSNLIFSVGLKQLNYNTNPRSTIATYYKMDHYLKTIYAEYFNLNYSDFSFNKFKSTCKRCGGLGFELIPDESLIIDYDLSINDVPFYPWKGSYSGFFSQLLRFFAQKNNIPVDIPVRMLSDNQIKKLFDYIDNEKVKINFYNNGRKRVKTSNYVGIKQHVNKMILDNNPDARKYAKKIVCSSCKGTRFSEKINSLKINDKSIGDVYSLDFTRLICWINECLDKQIINTDRSKGFHSLLIFADNLIQLKLEYLNLNRSISSLSGGEFQRIRLSQMLNSKFNDLLLVLDEPLSSLHISEKEYIVKAINMLKKKNTIVVVEHDYNFIKSCDTIFALGEFGGRNGGYWISPGLYLENAYINELMDYRKSNVYINIKLEEKINNVHPFETRLPLNTCVGICGVSGSGKTTFARDVLPKFISNYYYITQKPLRGNVYSEVASYVGVLDSIRELYSKVNGVSKSLFSHHFNSDGTCEECSGKGKIFTNDYEHKSVYVCPKCNGMKYNSKSLAYVFKGLNIYQILNMDITEAFEFFKDQPNIYNKLKIAIDIGLGYLKLSQSIETLSGGENQRIKFLKYFGRKNCVIAMDEPFRGLNNIEIYAFFKLIDKFVEYGNTVFIIEHNIYSIKLCSYLVEFGPKGGVNGGQILYNGSREDINNSNDSIIKSYLYS